MVTPRNSEVQRVMPEITPFETIALRKILALGTRQIEEEKVQPAGEVLRRLRNRNNGIGSVF